jgi:iron complex transport system substrate-binding protein
MWSPLFSRREEQRKSRLFLVAPALAICLAMLAASNGLVPASSEVCVRDGLARNVCVPRPVKRVISFAPSLTETVFALNAGPLLVGRSRLCNRPREALKVQEIGAYLNPDIERVIALRPDLVLTTKTGARRELVQRLERLGVPVFVDNSRNLDDILELIERLGVLLSRERDAGILVKELRSRRRAIRERVEGLKKPTVFLAVGIRPLVAAGGKSFIGSLIREAAGTNIAETSPIPYPRFGMEEVIRKDPNMILFLTKECPDPEQCREEWRRFPVLKAVKGGQLYELDADLMARPSPGIIDALEKLVAIFHPEVSHGAQSAEASGPERGRD